MSKVYCAGTPVIWTSAAQSRTYRSGTLVDWASIFVSGRSSILTALWARALIEFAELSEVARNSGSAQWARELYDSARAGFEDFWDSNRGVYLDHIVDNQRQPAASQ